MQRKVVCNLVLISRRSYTAVRHLDMQHGADCRCNVDDMCLRVCRSVPDVPSVKQERNMRIVRERLPVLCSTEGRRILSTEELRTGNDADFPRPTAEITVLHAFLDPFRHGCSRHLLLVEDIEELRVFLQPVYLLVNHFLFLLPRSRDH